MSRVTVKRHVCWTFDCTDRLLMLVKCKLSLIKLLVIIRQHHFVLERPHRNFPSVQCEALHCGIVGRKWCTCRDDIVEFWENKTVCTLRIETLIKRWTVNIECLNVAVLWIIDAMPLVKVQVPHWWNNSNKCWVSGFLTPVSMQTTHSELPGPSTGLGADGVTGVPGVGGVLGIWKAEVLGRNGGEGVGAVGVASASSSSWGALQASGRGENQTGWFFIDFMKFQCLDHHRSAWNGLFKLCSICKICPCVLFLALSWLCWQDSRFLLGRRLYGLYQGWVYPERKCII